MKPFVAIDIFGKACVPWSVPDIGNVTGAGGRRHRFAKKNPKLEEWQLYVKQEAEKAMERLGIVLGPVRVGLVFYKKTPPGKRHGELWEIDVEWSEEKEKYVKKGRSSPDLCNLFKGTEDALEGVIYANDGQTCLMAASRFYGPLDGVSARIYLIEPGDFPGHGNPVGATPDDPKGETSADVRVRGRADRAPRQRSGEPRKPRRKNPVGVAVPRAGGDGVPGDPPAA